MRLLVAGIVAIGFISLMGCDEGNIRETPTPGEIYQTDLEIINDYLADNNYEYNDTTESGTRVLIFDTGDGESPQNGEIVTFDYTGRFLFRNSDEEVIDTIFFETTIEDVSDEENIPLAAAITYTFSNDGWTLAVNNYVVGFREGVTRMLSEIEVGGNGEIVLPSAAAYGPRGTLGIPGNSVLVFEIYLRSVEE